MASLEKHREALMAKPGVIGVGLGLRDGKPTIVCLVAKEREHEATVPDALDGVPVRVELSSSIEPQTGQS